MSKVFKNLSRYITSPIPPHWVDKPGVEAYNYYISLSNSLPKGSVISDLGTYQGLSALALSANPGVSVVTYDITQKYNIVDDKRNIEVVLGNVFDYMDEIVKSDLILVDVDPHDGIQEQKIYEELIDKNYKGISVWDDIHHNVGMETFWRSTVGGEDVTKLGHHSGTGIIYHANNQR